MFSFVVLLSLCAQFACACSVTRAGQAATAQSLSTTTTVTVLQPLMLSLGQLYRLYSLALYVKLLRSIYYRRRPAKKVENIATDPFLVYIWCDPPAHNAHHPPPDAPFVDPDPSTTIAGVAVGITFSVAQMLMMEGQEKAGGWVVTAEAIILVLCMPILFHHCDSGERSREHLESSCVFIFLAGIAVVNNSLALQYKGFDEGDVAESASDIMGIITCIMFSLFIVYYHLVSRYAQFEHYGFLRFFTVTQVFFNFWLLVWNIFVNVKDKGDLQQVWPTIRLTASIGYRLHCVVYFASMSWPNGGRHVRQGANGPGYLIFGQDPAGLPQPDGGEYLALAAIEAGLHAPQAGAAGDGQQGQGGL